MTKSMETLREKIRTMRNFRLLSRVARESGLSTNALSSIASGRKEDCYVSTMDRINMAIEKVQADMEVE